MACKIVPSMRTLCLVRTILDGAIDWPTDTHSSLRVRFWNATARMLRDRGEMDERDFKTYMSLFANMSNFMRKPNLIIYLDVNPEESAERIQLRSRDMEKSIPIDYLADLRAAYEEFIRDISRVIPVIRVSWSRFRTAEVLLPLPMHRSYPSHVSADDILLTIHHRACGRKWLLWSRPSISSSATFARSRGRTMWPPPLLPPLPPRSRYCLRHSRSLR